VVRDKCMLCGSGHAPVPRTSLGTANAAGCCGPSGKLTGELGGGMGRNGSESLVTSSAGGRLRDLLFRVGCPAGGDDNQGS